MMNLDKVMLVLGMHRSGTSFLAHCAELLGYALPQDRGGPASDNPRGHFEPRAIVALNDRVMARSGEWWARIAPPSSLPSPAEMDAALAESFGGSRRVVIKDPRMSLLMPAWRPHLEARSRHIGALIALRHPGETASSLGVRNDMPADMAYLSWIAHTLSALEATEGMARALIVFPDWTAEIGGTLRRIATVMGDNVPAGAEAEVAARFDASAVHGGRQRGAEDPQIDALARELFDLTMRHARAGSTPEAGEIAPLRARFESLSITARAVEQGATQRLRDQEERLNARAQDISGLQAELVRLQTSAAQDIQVMQGKVDELMAHISATEAQRDASEEQRRIDAQSHAAQMAHMAELLNRERLSVLKPIYRRLHMHGGRALRRVLPTPAFERLKRALPRPGGVPGHLAYHPPQSPSGHPEEFAQIPPGDPDRPDIFVMSIINWDFRTQRPQHLATELARLGHRVFYIEMESDPRGSAREVAPSVHVIRLPARGMGGVRAYAGTVPAGAQRAFVDHFYALADQVAVSPRAHVIVEHPYWWNFVRHLAPQFRITFDCMDEIAGFANTEAAILEAEADMIANADRMIVSSQYLHDKYAPTRPVAMVRNGTDVSHFIRAEDDTRIPDFLRGKLRDGGVKVGYVGAIAEWFDTDLVEQVARNNPDFDIHLCGAVTAEAPARLDRLANITMHGEIPYADVPAFILAMDVVIIPFQLLPIIKACDPVKFYEYSALRRPTVATALPELERAGDLVITASDAASFAEGIRKGARLTHDASHGAALRGYALENSWQDRATDLLAEMERAPLLSVVILAYGAADLTLACLHSLLGRGEVYPALEIIVADNGSPEAELARLRAAAEDDPRIRLIENGENLGFARGNNVGIEAASGEYVLLLNNDTYVPPGALSAMVSHLERHPGLGIVGPLTNNIGNEARVEVSYDTMDEMEQTARALTTGYRGQITPIPVCAYFCAMFRRSDLVRIGGLPTDYGRGMFEDDDHCAQFRAAGMEIALAEDAFVHHHLSATFSKIPSAEKAALFEQNKAFFEKRWGTWKPHQYRQTRPSPSLPDTP